MKRPTAMPLTKDESLALVAACGRGFMGARDRAMLAVLIRAGLRADELCQQRRADCRLDGKHLVIRVSRPKGYDRGATQRELTLDKRATDLVIAWMAIRVEYRPSRLFVTCRDGSLQPSHVRRRVAQLAATAGIGRRVHPHCLRATFASHLYLDGVGIREIQEGLGHARLDTTAIYLSSIGATQLAAAMKERDW